MWHKLDIKISLELNMKWRGRRGSSNIEDKRGQRTT